MIINYCSDLHLDINQLDYPLFDNNNNAHMLILAGDTFSLNTPNINFINHIANQYQYIIYILGNHEHYHHNFNNSVNTIKNLTNHLNNFIILNNNYIQINDWIFFGGTLWTNYNNNPVSVQNAHKVMNDYNFIHTNTGKFTTNHALQEFNQFIRNLDNAPKQNTVVISHHLPSYSCIEPKYATSYANPYYASNLDDIILNNTHIKYWIYGHSHQQKIHKINQCTLAINAHGYSKYEPTLHQSFSLQSISLE